MRTRNWVVVLVVTCAVWPGIVRANLIATWSASLGSGAHVVGYSASGQLIQVPSPASEELNSIRVGPDGNYYVLSNVIGWGNVYRFTLPSTQIIESLVSYDVQQRGTFTIPFGLAFDPAGQLYVGSNTLSFGDPTVYRVDGSGLTRVTGVSGNYLLRDIEFDSTGNLFVAMDGLGIRRSTGRFHIPSFTIPVATHDFDFGPDGKLYAATPSQGVLAFDPSTGESLGAFVPAGSQGLVDADNMVFGGDGVLYVHSPGAKKILKFDATTGAPLGVFTDYSAAPATHISSIAWTDQPIPEPHTGLAILFGAACVVGGRRRRTKSTPTYMAA